MSIVWVVCVLGIVLDVVGIKWKGMVFVYILKGEIDVFFFGV